MITRQQLAILSLALELQESMIMYQPSNNMVQKRELNDYEIDDTVSIYFGVSVKLIKSQRRDGIIKDARFFSMYFRKRIFPQQSLKSIGEEFGGRDHTTVINAINVITERLMNDNDDYRKYHSALCHEFNINCGDDYEQAMSEYKQKNKKNMNKKNIVYITKKIIETPVVKFERVNDGYSNHSPYRIASPGR